MTITANTAGNWQLYQATPLPEGAIALGTVTREDGQTGALVRLGNGRVVQMNAGVIRTLGSIPDAARALRAIPSEARTEASRVNGKRGGRPPKAPMAPTLHRDGSVTYWSVYDQTWRHRQLDVPARELAAMGPVEREAVIRPLR